MIRKPSRISFIAPLLCILAPNPFDGAAAIRDDGTVVDRSNFPADLVIVELETPRPSDLGRLIQRDITITQAGGTTVQALVSPEEREWLVKEGFQPRTLYRTIAESIGGEGGEAALDDFHSYPEMTSELQQIAGAYPQITRLEDLGHSVQGRTIWGLKVTANPDDEEDEPEVRICGLHHGNEWMSAEIPLLLAWHLVENYGTDPSITRLVDEREIWIIPMVNPDGREAMTLSSRYNANGVDLNRDYGYMWDGSGGSPSPFSQPETQVIRSHALQNQFVVSLSFHCSGNIVNYLWNYTPVNAPDYDLISLLSEGYGDYNGYWVVEGYNWYQTRGDTNDFSYGCRGDFDWTIEVQNNNIPGAWDLNRGAILELIDVAGEIGVAGKVTDAATGEPLVATVWAEEAYWPCFTDPETGDYHRLLLPGTYILHFRANGYTEQIHIVDVIASGDPVVLDAALVPGDDRYAEQVAWCNFYDPFNYPNNFQNNPTNATSALGPGDNVWASPGVGGEIVLDMGLEGRVSIGEGGDFTVYEGAGAAEGFEVYGSNTWNGPWTFIGEGMGTTTFDLETVNLETARYIRIVDDGGGSPSETNPGFDLDAVLSLHPPLTTLHIDNSHPEFVIRSGEWNSRDHPNAYNGDTRFIRAGTGSGKAGWRVDTIARPGRYEVYVWKFEHENLGAMATNAHHAVLDRTGLSDWIPVDQSSPGNGWVYLGSFEFDDRSLQGVMITDEADGFVIADAVRLDYIGPLPE